MAAEKEEQKEIGFSETRPTWIGKAWAILFLFCIIAISWGVAKKRQETSSKITSAPTSFQYIWVYKQPDKSTDFVLLEYTERGGEVRTRHLANFGINIVREVNLSFPSSGGEGKWWLKGDAKAHRLREMKREGDVWTGESEDSDTHEFEPFWLELRRIR